MSTILNSETVWRALAEAAARSPERTMYGYREEPISFGEVKERTDRIASALLALGIGKGDRIGLVGLNQPEWLYTYFAAAKIGAVVVALSPRYRDVEIEYMLNQSRARALVCLARTAEMDYVRFFNSFRPKIPTVREYVFIGGQGFEGSALPQRVFPEGRHERDASRDMRRGERRAGPFETIAEGLPQSHRDEPLRLK